MKHVGYLIKEPGRDPRYPKIEFNVSDLTDADREYGFTSEPVYTLDDADLFVLGRNFAARYAATWFLIGVFVTSLVVLLIP